MPAGTQKNPRVSGVFLLPAISPVALVLCDRLVDARVALRVVLLLRALLGVRRVGVTGAASALQRKHLISYSRGVVTVLNRRGLEAASCPCYRLTKNVYDRILG